MKSILLFTAMMMVVMAGTSGAQTVPEYKAELIETYQAFDARQGVAVDEEYFYAVNSYRITKHQKSNGAPLIQWDGESFGKVLHHLDSGMIYDGKLYAAHSNYSLFPMTSSIEIWDAKTLEHVGNHSFGIYKGSFTWLDRDRGYWWGAFANYDKVQKGMNEVYGGTKNTKIVKMDDDFQVLQSWVLPKDILKKVSPMSNSGGSWGNDGFLYLTAHDYGEVYVMQLPKAGSVLHHAATVKIEGALEGQGIAWDRSQEGAILWGIRKNSREVYKIKMPKIIKTTPFPKARIRTTDFNK